MKFFDFMNLVGKKFTAGELKESKNPDENEISIFDFVPNGTVYAASEKKTARATISLPKCVCGDSISDLFEWDIKIIAVKKTVVRDIVDMAVKGE